MSMFHAAILSCWLCLNQDRVCGVVAMTYVAGHRQDLQGDLCAGVPPRAWSGQAAWIDTSAYLITISKEEFAHDGKGHRWAA
jgi:hypothetical protein